MTARKGPLGALLLPVFWAVFGGIAVAPFLLFGLFPGLGSLCLAAVVILIVTRPRRQAQHSGDNSVNIQAGRDVVLPYDGCPGEDEE